MRPRLVDGAQAERGGAIAVPSASTCKIAIMMALLRKAHAGLVDLDQPNRLTAPLKQDVASGSTDIAPCRSA